MRHGRTVSKEYGLTCRTCSALGVGKGHTCGDSASMWRSSLLYLAMCLSVAGWMTYGGEQSSSNNDPTWSRPDAGQCQGETHRTRDAIQAGGQLSVVARILSIVEVQFQILSLHDFRRNCVCTDVKQMSMKNCKRRNRLRRCCWSTPTHLDRRPFSPRLRPVSCAHIC